MSQSTNAQDHAAQRKFQVVRSFCPRFLTSRIIITPRNLRRSHATPFDIKKFPIFGVDPLAFPFGPCTFSPAVWSKGLYPIRSRSLAWLNIEH